MEDEGKVRTLQQLTEDPLAVVTEAAADGQPVFITDGARFIGMFVPFKLSQVENAVLSEMAREIISRDQ